MSFDVDLDAALLDELRDSSQDGDGEHPEGASDSSENDVLFGAVLADRYRVLELIGKGGMGKVYLAEHIAIRKKVAIKVLSQAYCHRPDQVQRFLREAQSASTINHDNVIEIFDYGETDNGSVFFAMEMLEGQDLGGLLHSEQRLPWQRARRIFLQIARALQAAHSHGVIHRDIKPENCFVLQRPDKVDFVKVLDFGIAKVVDEERKNAHTLTQAGALIGTPEYMAPEQVQGGAADRRMDIYSVGCIMYQALTGELPFEDATMFGVLTKQVSEDPLPLRAMAPDAEIPQAVEDVVLRAMEKSLDDRYQTMAELAEAIESLGDSPLATASSPEDSMSGFAAAGALPGQQQTLQRAVIGLGVVVVLLCGLLVYFALGSDAGETSENPELIVAASSADAPAGSGTTVDSNETLAGTETETETDTDSETESGSETTDAATGELDSEGASSTGRDRGSSKTTKKRPGKKKSAAPDPNLPKELDLFGRDSGIRSVREAVKKCRGVGGAAAGTQVKVAIKVSGRTGKVLSASPSSGGAAGQCVAKAVKKAKFPRFQKSTQKFTQAFRL